MPLHSSWTGGGGGVGGINTPGMGGGGGDEDGAGGARADCDAVLQASGKSLDSLPGGVLLQSALMHPCP